MHKSSVLDNCIIMVYIYSIKLIKRGNEMKSLNALDWIALILIIIGGLNWGLIGAFDFNLVTFLLGKMPVLQTIIYLLVGLSALYGIYMLASLSKK